MDVRNGVGVNDCVSENSVSVPVGVMRPKWRVAG